MFISNFKRNKKGDFKNYLALIIILFILGFGSILGYVFHQAFIDGFTTAGYYTGVIKETGDKFTSFLLWFDYLIVLVLCSGILAIAINNYRVATKPAFYILVFFTSPLLGLVSYFFNHIFYKIVTQNVLITANNVFPNTMILCTNFHWVALGLIVIGSLTLYAKKEKGQFIE